MSTDHHVIVIGAGIGGLTAAALLLKNGIPVTVMEAQPLPGGSASTFFHQGYHFDAGATLAGGFGPGGPHAQIAEILGINWPTRPINPAWIVHLGDKVIPQWNDRDFWHAEMIKTFPGSESFWKIQEQLSRISWQLSTRRFPWPPASFQNIIDLFNSVRWDTLAALPYLTQKVSDIIPEQVDPLFRTFLDAQLLISAQTTSEHANLLYGSAALDLPRQGVNTVYGGIGALAQTLVQWITQHGGKILYRQEVTQIEFDHERAVAVRTNKGLRFECDWIIANLTPPGLEKIMDRHSPTAPNHIPQKTWGAFTLYLGIDSAYLPNEIADHHQIIVDPSVPLGEGNSLFLSLSDINDPSRAPKGMRAATLSTHTLITPWWNLYSMDRPAYERQKGLYTQRLIDGVARIIPNIEPAIRLNLPGTPVTFERFTHRPLGMVGGYAQTSLIMAPGPRTGTPNIYRVGDSIFPGQSTAGVTMGALRVAHDVIKAVTHTQPHWLTEIDHQYYTR